MKTRRSAFAGEAVIEVLNPPRQIYRGVFSLACTLKMGKQTTEQLPRSIF